MEFVKIAEKDGSIILADSDGNKASFDFLEMLVLNDVEYAALVQLDTDDLVILQFTEQQNGHEVYSTIDDDATFEKVAGLFENLLSDD